MSKFTKEMVQDYALKLLIGLNEEEIDIVLKEFDDIDKTIDKINNIEGIKNIPLMTHTLDDFYVNLREDEKDIPLDIKETLKNVKCVEGREIVVPKVVDNNG